ncbi:MAG TPA: acylneuraminate cytidylyltransferase family protein [Burkholderiales bacterium]|nr:acylneuraminate cytidylyltransferase family protein [Burkholderiales bacterium]
MIGAETVLAIIPARGGSKRLPRKNLREFSGKPLIAWTIEAAKRSRYLDRIMLSSEDEEIMRVARGLGCEVPFARPAELATDDAPGIAPVLDALARLPGYTWVVLLQPTSPLRSAQDIDACIDVCVRLSAPACVSVAPVPKSPYWMYTLGADQRLKPLLAAEEPRDRQPAFVLNGAVYVARTGWLQAKKTFVDETTVAHVMPPERSVDIDDEIDFKFAQFFFQERNHGTL